MKSKKEQVLETLRQHENSSASELAEIMAIDRANLSRYLNELVKEGLAEKIDGRPVKFIAVPQLENDHSFDALIGSHASLQNQVQKAKAAILYPPNGLHTIIFGDTGTGKSMFAEYMYYFALESGALAANAPFITFNCADYAQNPQLLYGHIFGVKKGAYTGAEQSSEGLLAQADHGILFLDEIHRLPPEGQEMLFTFIDKGIFRPLGSSEEKTASVRIIGATTEQSSSLLKTFNRRIPMQIELPALKERTFDERLALIEQFLQSEANGLERVIVIDKKSLAALLMYQPEGNVGQLKRDIKLVCAKAFLRAKMAENDEILQIDESILPFHIQKGLLNGKKAPHQVTQFLHIGQVSMKINPGKQEVEWHKEQLPVAEQVDEVDLAQLIDQDEDEFFDAYLDELAHTNVYRELISDKLWELTNELCDECEQELQREFNHDMRFTFALHLNAMIERVRQDSQIEHPDLNEVRRHHKEEFRLALECASKIEAAYDIAIPLDEVGFIAMFLTIDRVQNASHERKVQLLVVMHGASTASSMLEAAQQLLGTSEGIAFDMPLSVTAESMYETVQSFISQHRDECSEGVLLLTDMGSPNNFAHLLSKAFNLKVKVISLTSTMVVLESLRLIVSKRSLDDIYESVTKMLINNAQTLLEQIDVTNRPKAVVVSCFTGEGVAQQMKAIVKDLITDRHIEIIAMQSLDKEKFRHDLQQVASDYQILAIVGTIEIQFEATPFFRVTDLFNRKQLLNFQEAVGVDVHLDMVTKTLMNALSDSVDVKEMIYLIEQAINLVQEQQGMMIHPSALQGLVMHIALLIDNIGEGHPRPDFKNVKTYYRQHLVLFKQLESAMQPLEEKYHIQLTRDDLAYIVQVIDENRLMLTK